MAPCDEVVHIRRAHADDARGIAELHVMAWRDAHRDRLPAPALSALSVDERERYWTDELRVMPADRRPWVAEAAGRIVGFVASGGSHSESGRAGTGEVYAIYVLAECWDRGVGRTLLAHAEHDLLKHGYSEAVLWVTADDESARYFYELAGWHADGATKTHDFAGHELAEVRYRLTLDKSRVGELV